MNKKISLMALALLVGAAFVSSCTDDDESTPVSEESRLVRFYTGTTMGSSVHFQNMPSTSSDTVYVRAAKANSSNFDIVFKSDFWGDATFENVSAKKVDGVYQLSDTEGTINMPQRRPGMEEVTYKDYPATLKGSTIRLQDNQVSAFDFVIEANLGERAGIYVLELKNN